MSIKSARAKQVLCDFDGTVAPDDWPNSPGPPRPEAIAALRRLKEAGLHIVIFSARLWKGWDFAYRQEQINEMLDWLVKYEVPFDEVTNEKRPALVLIDDTSMNPNLVDWDSIVDYVLRRDAEWKE